METPVLETHRLLLRPFAREDAPAVFAGWESDPEVARYMFWTAHQDPARSVAWVEEELEKQSADDWYRWAVCSKEDGTLLGTVLLYWEEEYRSFEVSYNFGRVHWGKGYCTEAMEAALAFAGDLGVGCVMGRRAAVNAASGRVLEKLGFQFVREIPYECGDGTVLAGLEYRWNPPVASQRLAT